MENIIEGKTFEKERSLYGLKDAEVRNCRFGGPEDGESPLKEGRNLLLEDSEIALRYPLWHLKEGTVKNCTLTDLARAALWYAEKVSFFDAKILSVKFLRECRDIALQNVEIEGDEFGWKSSSIKVHNATVKSMYSFLDASKIEAKNMKLDGKYSLQYVSDSRFENCSFVGRDAFWHAKDVTIVDSTLEGEYLAWYSENLTLIRCRINSHQPLCYCKNLKLVDCTFGEESDLAFENSEVNGNVIGPVPSITNMASGEVHVGKGTKIIDEPDVYEHHGLIVVEG